MKLPVRFSRLFFLNISVFFMFTLPLLPSNLKAIAIAVFALSVICLRIKRPWHFHKRFFLTNSIVYLLFLVTLLWVDNWDYAFSKLQTTASLIVFPLLFSLLNSDEREEIYRFLEYYIWAYIFSIFLLNSVPFIYYYVSNPNYDFGGMLQHFPTIMQLDTGKYSIHPIYLSMHCSIAIVFSFFLIKKIKKRYVQLLLIGINLSLVFFLLVYAKKGPLIALIVVSTLHILFQQKKKILKTYIAFLIALIGLTIILPKTRNAFIELFKIETIGNGNITSTNVRYSIYKIAIEKIENKPLIGYSIGDYNEALQNAYKSLGSIYLLENKFNAHNQYLSFCLIGGVFLLLAFLVSLSLNMIYAIRFNNRILIMLLIFYGLVMFTENILEREDGVIYYAFFISFFGLISHHKNYLEND